MLKYYENHNGPRIATKELRAVKKDGLWFRDMSRTGQVLPFEDWRNSPEERAQDLAGRLSQEEMAGLMIYTAHQHVPYYNTNTGLPCQYYRKKEYRESKAAPWEATDQQKDMVEKEHIRHFLMAQIEGPSVAARWANELQGLAEKQPWAIPISFASDPRHGVGDGAEYKLETAGLSGWPQGEAMACTFDQELCREGARIMARELRAMGVTTYLGPQIDLATEPRWMRSIDTFGPDLSWNKKLTKAFCDGMQTTEGAPGGWGTDSVAVMVKHWPGGGTGEGGRDAHYAYGKYAVFPGGLFGLHQKPFTEAAFCLGGPTCQAAAVMPYYTVSWLPKGLSPERVGNSYSKYLVRDLLRGQCGYQGIVCTDWGITEDMPRQVEQFAGKCYGVEHLTEAERCLILIENGIDQIAGTVSQMTLLEAFGLGIQKQGERQFEARIRQSAYRILLKLVRLGLFENPYVDLEESRDIWNNPKYHAAGYAAQLKSAVLLKNRDRALPLQEKIKLYVPERVIQDKIDFFSMEQPQRRLKPVPKELLSQYAEVVKTPREADAAIVFMESPDSIGYLRSDVEQGGNGYLPISLKYRPYKAVHAREVSIAGGDPLEGFCNRSYKNKTSVVYNEQDLENLLEMRRVMGEKRVIACIRMNHPMVMEEVEPYADAILVECGISKQALLDLIFGRQEPAGRLSFALPRDMDSLEQHMEDVPFDYPVYQDECHHRYEFGFGMGWDRVLGQGTEP